MRNFSGVLVQVAGLLERVLVVVLVGELLVVKLWLVKQVALQVLTYLFLLLGGRQLLQLTQYCDVEVRPALVHCQALFVLVVDGYQNPLVTELRQLNGFVNQAFSPLAVGHCALGVVLDSGQYFDPLLAHFQITSLILI